MVPIIIGCTEAVVGGVCEKISRHGVKSAVMAERVSVETRFPAVPDGFMINQPSV
jgi:hypothetical protein